MTASLITQLLITLGICIPAFLAGLFGKRLRNASVEVTLSKESREWAGTFLGRAQAAEARTERIEERLHAAERATDEAEARCRECQQRITTMERHIRALERAMHVAGVAPPTDPTTGQ